MENIYLLMMVALVVLAVADLIIGVSNDAVNFLNSAIGSKAIPFKGILLIASIGIFLGAGFSSGMMEIARSGVLNPSQFYFSEIMIIFMAVLIKIGRAHVLTPVTFRSRMPSSSCTN